MPRNYAVAVSSHPVSAYATGEAVGQLLETVGTGPGLVLVAATPGHWGALEDIAATFARLLEPSALMAVATTGVGTPGLPPTADVIAAWSCAGGQARSFAPDPAGVPAAGGALVLAGASGAVLVGGVAGPVVAGDGQPGPGPVGAAVGAELTVTMVRAMRPVGPSALVTAAEGTTLLSLDGSGALAWLRETARDAVAVADLPALSASLHVEVLGGPQPGELHRVLGAAPVTGGLVLDGRMEVGAAVRLCFRDLSVLDGRIAAGLPAGTASALVLVGPGQGRAFGAPSDLEIPVLWCETTARAAPGAGGTAGADEALVGSFPSS